MKCTLGEMEITGTNKRRDDTDGPLVSGQELTRLSRGIDERGKEK